MTMCRTTMTVVIGMTTDDVSMVRARPVPVGAVVRLLSRSWCWSAAACRSRCRLALTAAAALVAKCGGAALALLSAINSSDTVCDLPVKCWCSAQYDCLQIIVGSSKRVACNAADKVDLMLIAIRINNNRKRAIPAAINSSNTANKLPIICCNTAICAIAVGVCAVSSAVARQYSACDCWCSLSAIVKCNLAGWQYVNNMQCRK